MSSRNDHRRQDRSWERSDRDRDRDRHRDRDRGGDRDRGRGDRYRDSRRRSRSRSPRRGDHDRRSDRDRRDYRHDDRRDSDRRDRDDRRKDDKRDDRDRRRDDLRDRDVPKNPGAKLSPGSKEESVPPVPEPRVPSEGLENGQEEGESMDAVNQDDEAMMGMMGMASFGSTKGKHVEGNQEGSAKIKKVRTWRQYMNRRGGFNRPLDKIK
ncbi:DUF1777-domain-containing protein [Thelephora ganbajun]|uniref:DUF1777-domain-containing protein n=1 Tax=Thelephora ganbajun TaxID=370292 RepID=A0ACB6ZPI7_THEGA|nr:DUF1777-domain-containing protein [Thelephora ganbajun]